MTKKVTIINFHHDDNKGDSAIVLASINNLRRLKNDIDFNIVSQFRYQKGKEFRHLKHLLKGKVKYHHSLFPRLDEFWVWMPFYVPRVFVWSLFLTFSLSKDVFNYFVKRKKRKPIGDTDLLLFSGGQFMYKWNLFYWPMFFFHLYPLILGLVYQVPSVIHCISIPNFPPRTLVSFIFKKILNQCKIIAVREKASKKNLLRLGVNKSLIKVVPDPAFLLTRKANLNLGYIGKKYNLKKNRYVTLTVRKLKNKSDNYLFEINRLINVLAEEYRVVILATSLGPEKHEDDRIAIKEIAKTLKNKERVILITEDLSPIECLKVIANSKLLIGTRFHSLVFGASTRTPLIAISYSPKTSSTFLGLGYSNPVVEINNIDGKAVMAMTQKVIGNEKSIIKRMGENIKSISENIDNYNTKLLDLL